MTAAGAHRTVIVGAGQAGAWVASTLREADPQRDIVLLGEESWPPYERPPVSKGFLAGKSPAEAAFIRPPAFYGDERIDLRLGTRVQAVDRGAGRVRCESGEALAYDSLVLATGARARRLEAPGSDLPQVVYLRTLDDAQRLRARLAPGARLAVVGAGFIGLEVAATAVAAGAAVTVIEAAAEALSRVIDRSVARQVVEIHAARGVSFRFGVRVAEFAPAGPALAVVPTQGPAIEADVAVVGIGAVPDTALAQACGLAVDDGILVDEFGRSSDPAIRAVGDATRHFNPLLGRLIRLESWQNAQNQAIAVAKAMAGGTAPYAELPWMWTDQYDLNLQHLGAPLRWDRVLWRGGNPASRGVAFYLDGDRVVAGDTLNSGRDMRFVKQIVARGSVDLARLEDPAVPLAELCRN